MSGTALLEMKHIHKKFPGVYALKDINFELRTGEVHALLGENGAGKSTLIKVLGGIYTADEGEIIINGKKVNNYNIHSSYGLIDSVLRERGVLIHEFMHSIGYPDLYRSRGTGFGSVYDCS